QDPAALAELTRALVAEAARRDPTRPVPVLVKIAPDLTWSALDALLGVVTGAGVSGLIAANTTLARDALDAELEHAAEPGGLSGVPLTLRAREVVAYLTAHTDLPVIGCGGILTAADGQALLDAGARLLQVYTGFIYRGPALVRELNRLQIPRAEVAA
ncbi:MAG: dihydroorotate dehydrogenase (quinone), partial [Actinomycetes bacterium]